MIDFNEAMRLTNINELNKEIKDRYILIATKNHSKKIEMEIIELEQLIYRIMIAQSYD